MKICFLELMPFPYTVGGGTTHIMNLGKALCKLGNEVHVISSRPAKEYTALEYHEEIKVHNVGFRHEKFEGGVLGYFYRLLFELAFVIGAWREIRKIKPDIIDCQSSITTALPASLNKSNFVITCHGIHSLGFGKLYASKGIASRLANKVYEKISEYNLSKTKAVISQGEDTLGYYRKLSGNRVKGFIVANMVDGEFWSPSGKKKENLIVTVARFTKQKALDKLVLAMKMLKSYRLKLVGGGELDAEIRKLAPDNVEFLGFLNPREVKEQHIRARFTILPSEFEGLPYAVLEAMACELVPIVTKVGDLKTLIEDGKNGFFLKNNKPSTIAEAVERISKLDLNKIGKSARKTVLERFGADKIGREFLRIYKSL